MYIPIKKLQLQFYNLPNYYVDSFYRCTWTSNEPWYFISLNL